MAEKANISQITSLVSHASHLNVLLIPLERVGFFRLSFMEMNTHAQIPVVCFLTFRSIPFVSEIIKQL